MAPVPQLLLQLQVVDFYCLVERVNGIDVVNLDSDAPVLAMTLVARTSATFDCIHMIGFCCAFALCHILTSTCADDATKAAEAAGKPFDHCLDDDYDDNNNNYDLALRIEFRSCCDQRI